MTKPECLYHFNCGHARRQIGRSNCLLLPFLHPWLGVKLVWLTDQGDANRELTGLTMKMQPCDRMEFRYTVTDTDSCRPWLSSLERMRLDPERLRAFETLEDGRASSCEHWWFADKPIRARFDRAWRLVDAKAS